MSKPQGRNRRSRNTVTTRSGNSIKINRSLVDRAKARKAERAAAKAAYLSTLPKDRWKRTLYRMHPKRVAEYWFSREGGIMALRVIGISIIVGFFLTIGMFAYFRKDLPKIKDLSGKGLGGSITYYDRTGKTVLFNDYDSVKRFPVEGKEMSSYIRQATVATEDKDFYNHGAFDVRGIMRAAFRDVAGGGGSPQGGSTITQQLVKLNENWTDNRTVTRKVKELILAVELEREYSKDDILTGYLNIAPYGSLDYGVESASRDYFQTSAKNLTLPQAAMLAAIPKSPGILSPYGAKKYNPAVTVDVFIPKALIARQHYVLDRMAQQGYVTKKQAEAAKKVDILAQIHPQSQKWQGIRAPYFVLAAKQELQETLGYKTVQIGGFKVITTLDVDLQNKAEQLVNDNLGNVSRYGADEEAMVAEDVKTGQIVSLVGGVDFTNTDYGKLNYAAGVLIPPGSSFKPYDYAALINNNNNVGAGSVLYDQQGPLPGYPCTNKAKKGGNCLQDYDFIYPGPLTLRYSLGGSRNVPAVKAMLSSLPNDKSNGRVDSVNKVIGTASAMMNNSYNNSRGKKSYNCYGDEALTQIIQCYGAAAIGDGAFLHLDDHVNGLATLARLGKTIPRTYILKVTNAADKTVKEFKQPKSKQVLKADAAYIVNDMASDWRASYLPGSCSDTNCTPLHAGGYKFHRYNGWRFAVKTGTTNDGYDGLMTSWSTKYAMVSWVGHHSRRVTLHSSMENLTEPITRGWMEYAHANVKASNWKQPSSIKTAPAFVVRKHIHYGDVEPSPTNDLFPGWYVGGGSTRTTSQTIDKVSNKVATSCTPALAKDNAANANAASWNVDIFNGGRTNIGSGSSGSSTSTTATDDVHNCSDTSPSITLTAPNNCDTSCTITATVTQGTHPLSDPQYAQFPGKVTFTLNGQTIKTKQVSDSPSTVSFTYTPSSSGSGTLSATVTDSVLYQGSDSMPFSYNNSSISDITDFTALISGSQIQFNWSGGTPSYDVVRTDNNLSLCSGVSGNSCSASKSLAPSGTSVTLRDSNGKTKTATTSP